MNTAWVEQQRRPHGLHEACRSEWVAPLRQGSCVKCSRIETRIIAYGVSALESAKALR